VDSRDRHRNPEQKDKSKDNRSEGYRRDRETLVLCESGPKALDPRKQLASEHRHAGNDNKTGQDGKSCPDSQMPDFS
jgi:hypothetical protein